MATGLKDVHSCVAFLMALCTSGAKTSPSSLGLWPTSFPHRSVLHLVQGALGALFQGRFHLPVSSCRHMCLRHTKAFPAPLVLVLRWYRTQGRCPAVQSKWWKPTACKAERGHRHTSFQCARRCAHTVGSRVPHTPLRSDSCRGHLCSEAGLKAVLTAAPRSEP